MTTFLDGPAKGQKLLLQTSPEILRVVVDENGKWDALDRPEDEPRPNETVHLYRRVSQDGVVHVNAGRRSGFYSIATYRFAGGEQKEGKP